MNDLNGNNDDSNLLEPGFLLSLHSLDFELLDFIFDPCFTLVKNTSTGLPVHKRSRM